MPAGVAAEANRVEGIARSFLLTSDICLLTSDFFFFPLRLSAFA